MPSGGDITEVTWNHPVLGTGRFFPKAGEDSTYNLCGYKTDYSDTQIDGSSAFINSMQQRPWSFEVVCAWDMINPNRQELESMVAMSGSTQLANWTFTNINGITYGGNGKIVSDIQGSGKDCTISLKVMGGGILQQI